MIFNKKLIRFVTWSNIYLQVIFPLAIMFSPAVIAVSDTQMVSPPQHERATNYTAHSESQKNVNVNVESQMATYAARIGAFLAGSPDSDVAASLVQGAMTSHATAEIQQWLSQFGTARVQINTDKHFSLKNSQFDLLAPIWDQENNLIFTQGSLHRTDDRTQLNFGLGWRHFTADAMLGVNTFWDYDLSRHHRRIGGGVEYWRDFLKFGANSYFRLSNWKDAPEQEDYMARPANGWDMRAEAWLPSYPQLGGRVVYEQYYGNEVALFGKDHRQESPHAITTGLSYTPVPLVTLSAEQRQGKGGKNDAKFGLEMNYQLGMPWNYHFDSSAVAALRTLPGSRYDLVERNDNIVLEYRKKNLIRLRAAALIAGLGGESKSLNVSVASKYGLDRIEWSDASLITNGGKIEHNGDLDYQIILPQYQSNAAASNNYMISAVAIDKKGNASNQIEIQVSVTAAAISAGNSLFEPKEFTLKPDGNSTQLLTLTLRNSEGQPVDVESQEIVLKKETQEQRSQTAAISLFQRQSVGVYVATITAGTREEKLILTPVVRNNTLNPITINIVQPAPDENQSTFLATPAEILANNSETATLTLTAKDDKGSAITDLKGLAFVVTDAEGKEVSDGRVVVSDVIVQDNIYTATLQGTLAGTYTVTVWINGVTMNSMKDEVTLRAGEVDAVQSTFSVAPTEIRANNIDSTTLSLTAKDANGNSVNNLQRMSFVVTEADGTTIPASQVVVSDVTTNGNVYTATLKGLLVGTHNVTVQVNGIAVAGLNQKITLQASELDASQSTLTTSLAEILANNSETTTLTLTAKDAKGNAINDLQDVLFVITDAAGVVVSPEKVTVSDVTVQGNIYTAILKGSKADNYTVRVQDNGAIVNDLNTAVKLRADVQSLDVTLSAEKVKVGESITLTVQAKNSAGESLENAELNLNVAAVLDRQKVNRADSSGKLQVNGSDIGAQSFKTDSNGQVHLTITDPKGIGVKSTVRISSESATVSESVIFTVLTSPDTDKAQYWGHMSDVITVNGVSFTRPVLATEYPESIDVDSNNEVWKRMRHDAFQALCGAAKMPSIDQLKSLYQANPNNQIYTVHGWPINKWLSFRSGTSRGKDLYASINLAFGGVGEIKDSNPIWVTCLK